MGCDIHAMIEKRAIAPSYEANDEIKLWPWWVNCGDPEFTRDYTLFGILAGVRDKIVPPIFLPRGMPENACREMSAWYQSWGEDAHSASYVTLAELRSYDIASLRKRKLVESYDVKTVSRLIRRLKSFMKGMPTIEGIGGRQIQDESVVRLVYFFDN